MYPEHHVFVVCAKVMSAVPRNTYERGGFRLGKTRRIFDLFLSQHS